MAEFSFFLTRNAVTTEVEEPIGWDGVDFSLRRSDLLDGLEFLFSDNLSFTHEGAAILKDAYDEDGIDAEVGITIKFCSDGVPDVLYQAVINFSIFKTSQTCPDDCQESITVGIQLSGMTQRFKNRIDTPVSLANSTGIDGNTLTEILPFDLRLHSKLIKKESRFSINPLLLTQTYEITHVDNATPYLAVPFRIEYGDVDTSMEVLSFTGVNTVYTNPILYTGFTYPAGIELRTIRVYGRLKVTVSCTAWPPGGAPFFVHLMARTVQDDDEIYFYPQEIGGPGIYLISVTDVPQTVDISFDYTLDLPPDCNLFFSTLFQSSIPSVQTYVFDAVTQLNLLEESVFPTSTTKAYLVHEAFYRLAEAITGVSDCFRSDFFGGIGSIVPYEADGCGRFLALTNGLNIRKMLDKNGDLFPVTTSFKDLFDALSAIYSLGMRVEMENGLEFIRVEPKSYFYNPEVSYIFKHVAEIERSVALDLIYNEAEFGYQKWETEAKNGIDEFNAKRNYSLPVIQAKHKLSNICQFVAGGYAIELTRRLQFATDPTTDSSYDNENFLIACNLAEVTSTLYTTPPVSTAYPAGTVSERDENYTDVLNIISPETAYNLRLSPQRMLLRWYPILAASMIKKTDPLVQFQSGTGNFQLSNHRQDACNEANELLFEGERVARIDVIPALRSPYYVPELYQFSFPISLRVFLQLKNKAIYAISFGCDTTIKGFLKEVQYSPAEGVAVFKIIRAYEP